METLERMFMVRGDIGDVLAPTDGRRRRGSTLRMAAAAASRPPTKITTVALGKRRTARRASLGLPAAATTNGSRSRGSSGDEAAAGAGGGAGAGASASVALPAVPGAGQAVRAPTPQKLDPLESARMRNARVLAGGGGGRRKSTTIEGGTTAKMLGVSSPMNGAVDELQGDLF